LDIPVVVCKERWICDVQGLLSVSPTFHLESDYLGRWISDLLPNVVHLLDSQVNDLLVHPLRCLQLFDKRILNFRYDSVPQLLCSLRKSGLDEESAEYPAQTRVNVGDAGSPSLRPCIGLLNSSQL
jgi:hypothetical protein